MRFSSPPDWLIYLLALSAVVYLFAQSAGGPPRQRAPAPLPAPSGAPPTPEGPLLGGPTPYDGAVLVDVGPPASGLGTAFAINSAGWWMTARHVVDSCQQVAILPDGRPPIPAEVRLASFADLALLRTPRARADALALDLTEDDFRRGQTAFHVGFPQGRPGEAASVLVRRETLVASGRYQLEQPVMVWTLTQRSPGLMGSLAGISGGPALDPEGRVVGVTIAESLRRGRIYTASPAAMVRLLSEARVAPQGVAAAQLTTKPFGSAAYADDLRDRLTVARVACAVQD